MKIFLKFGILSLLCWSQYISTDIVTDLHKFSTNMQVLNMDYSYPKGAANARDSFDISYKGTGYANKLSELAAITVGLNPVHYTTSMENPRYIPHTIQETTNILERISKNLETTPLSEAQKIQLCKDLNSYYKTLSIWKDLSFQRLIRNLYPDIETYKPLLKMIDAFKTAFTQVDANLLTQIARKIPAESKSITYNWHPVTLQDVLKGSSSWNSFEVKGGLEFSIPKLKPELKSTTQQVFITVINYSTKYELILRSSDSKVIIPPKTRIANFRIQDGYSIELFACDEDNFKNEFECLGKIFNINKNSQSPNALLFAERAPNSNRTLSEKTFSITPNAILIIDAGRSFFSGLSESKEPTLKRSIPSLSKAQQPSASRDIRYIIVPSIPAGSKIFNAHPLR